LTRTRFTPSGNDDIGFTETFNANLTVGVGGGASAGWYVQLTNANHLQDLSHWFWNVYVFAGAVIKVSGDVFWGKSSSGKSIYGVDIGRGVGVGYGGFIFDTNTWVQQAHNSFVANALRQIWDGFFPYLAVAGTIANLLKQVGDLVSEKFCNSSKL
jgi:hypothetical protein